VPAEHCHLVLVNGVFISPSERGSRRLSEGDHLAIWPPVAGGNGNKYAAGGNGNKYAAGGNGNIFLAVG